MDFKHYKELIDVASDHSKIVDFFQFAEKVHELADCTKDNCELGAYVGCLKSVLLNSTKTYEDKKSFFISHLIHFSDVYKFMSALKKIESYSLNLLEGLKYLRDSSESVNSRKRAVSLE